MTLEALERAVSTRYFSLPEREKIADLLTREKSLRAIAQALGRFSCTISREIKRNSRLTLGYQPFGAHRTAAASQARPKASKLSSAGELRNYMKDKLRLRWSPE